MIPRYEQPEISEIWSDQYKFQTFLKVEKTLLEVIDGVLIPAGVSQKYSDIKVDENRIREIEKDVKHDVIAFCTSITEQVPNEIGKFFHYGVTSSDIIDTSLTLQLKDSLKFIIEDVTKLRKELLALTNRTKEIICMGRSHGMFAEPMSFGAKWLSFYAEVSRREEELQEFINKNLTMQMSGAVGNHTILTPEIEEQVAVKLGLLVEPISTQVISRDHLAKLSSILSLLGTSMEQIVTEIRLLHHSDVAEVSEGFGKWQKGSSTMPHKKNPIMSENITGIARLLRSYLTAASENVLLWHERDISHSSAERIYLPDSLGLALYALRRLRDGLSNLEIHKDNIESKVTKNPTYLSSLFLHIILKETSLSRDEAYPIVQEASFETSNDNEFIAILKRKLNDQGVKSPIFPMDMKLIREIYTGNFEKVIERTLKRYPL